jgi:hypothetical protein
MGAVRHDPASLSPFERTLAERQVPYTMALFTNNFYAESKLLIMGFDGAVALAGALPQPVDVQQADVTRRLIKVLELLKEAIAAISRVPILWNPDHADPEFREAQRAATALGVRLQSLEVGRPGDFDGAFNAATGERAEGLIIVSTRLLLQQRRQIVEFGAKNRIIMGWQLGDWAKDRLLLTYGPSPPKAMRRIALIVSIVLTLVPLKVCGT